MALTSTVIVHDEQLKSGFDICLSWEKWMKSVRDVLREKGPDVWCIAPDASVYAALELMADKNLGALVVKENDRVIGLISERDYARKLILQGRASRDTSVRQVMTTRVAFTDPSQTLEECMALMTDKHIRHLPVLEDDKLIGVLSIGDAVKAVIAEQRFMIEQLEQYISG
jgi:CBS domain-containing protein